MTEPVTGLIEWAAGQSQPNVPVTALIRALAIIGRATAISVRTSAPGGTPADGDCYIVGPSGTSGILVGHEDQILYYDGGPKFLTAGHGQLWFITDQNAYKRFSGSAWQVWSPAWIPPVPETGTSRDATPDDAGQYVRFTNASAKEYVFDPSGLASGEGYVEGAEYQGRNVGAGDLTLVADGGMTLNVPTGGTLVIPQGGSFTVKIVGATEADVMGRVTGA